MPMDALNATSSSLAVNAIASPAFVWLMTIVVMVTIGLALFAVSVQFRKFVYGAIILGVVAAIYLSSSWISWNYGQGNSEPMAWFTYIIGGIFAAIIVGNIASALGLTKLIDDHIIGPEEAPTQKAAKKQ